jgi:tetratricopeptide (TPR) repeat protein
MDMSEFDIEFLTGKIAENPQSPLFARLADLYIQKEQTVEAVKLCEEGIQFHPKYYAGYIVLGKAHLVLKEYSKALETFERALTLSPFNDVLAGLIASIPNQPDESVRTTDETYFTPQAAGEEIQEQTIEPTIELEAPTPEEMGFSHVPEDYATAGLQAGQLFDSTAEPGSQSFPSFDDYFASQQIQSKSEPQSTLDDYLGGNITSIESTNDVSNVNEMNFESPMPEIEGKHESEIDEPIQEPEPVFSSPEQEQLFAEMMGKEIPEEKTPEPTIDDLAEKLLNVERIVPQDQYQSKSPIIEEKEVEQSLESEMVTPTLAEIYAQQEEYGAAIQAYEILMFSQPGKTGEFQQRIRELQQKQMEKDGLI